VAARLEKPDCRGALLEGVTAALGIDNARAAEPAGGQVEPRHAPRKLRILLAEDTPANRKLVMYLLGGRGHTIEVAENGVRAVELLRQQEFDVVLMDVQMPGMDGFQATRLIRRMREPKKAQVPIVAMTAYAMKADEDRCLAAGMNAYVAKPIDSRKLIDAVEGLAEHKAGTGFWRPGASRKGESAEDPRPETPAPTRPQIPNPPSLLPVFDMGSAIARCFGKVELAREMVDYFFEECPRVLEEIHSKVRGNDLVAAAQAAHRLKGTVVYLAAQPVLDAILGVEMACRSGPADTVEGAVHRLEEQTTLLAEAMAGDRGQGTGNGD
jgi:two-component system, sensor histidine kinase and response regulator